MKRLLWCLLILPGFLLVSCSDNSKAPQESLTAIKAGESSSEASAAPKVHKKARPKPIIPYQIHILGENAKVVPADRDGSALIPPRDPHVLGWWGKMAGARHGAILLVGHTVHTGGGTLDDLESIPVGKVIPILDWRRSSYREVDYKVVKNVTISKTALAKRASHLFSQSGPHKLVMVTCENYDWVTGHYGSNVVLTATPIDN